MLRGELFEEIDLSQLSRLTSNPDWGYQEKHNGERRTICKDVVDGHFRIRDFNREGGIGKGLPSHIRQALLRHPLPKFVIECELVKGDIFIFDALILGEEMLFNDRYEYREARYHAEFEGFADHIFTVRTVRGAKNKQALVLKLASEHAEGIICRNLKARYKQGRSGQHFKLKFVKECDVVVIGRNPQGKDSAEIGVYDNQGRLHRVSGCALRGIRVVPGDVLTVKYLYSSRDNHLVQPVLVRKRNDKSPRECTLSQLVMNKNFRGQASLRK